MPLCPAYHIPVLLHASVDGLDIRPGGSYADVTFGGGGHSREILGRLGPDGHLYAFDQDAEAEANLPEGDERFTFVRSNFRYLRNWMRYYGVDHLDGLIADLGVSSHHFDSRERGFSFRFDAPLDMRMNARAGRTAADLVMQADEARLADIFRLYGELRQARRLAAALVRRRAEKPVTTVGDLCDTLRPLISRQHEKKELAQVFQALRIEVNHEMDALRELLDAATGVLRPGGKLVVLTYHSLEDRIVKNFLRTGNAEGRVEEDFYGNRLAPFRPQSGKPILPTAREQEENPRSRSAKLRIGTRIPTPQNTPQ